MPPFLRSLALLIGAATIVIAMVSVGFLPLFGGPGYESALAAGLLLPFVVAIVTALEVSASRAEPFDAFCRGVANGCALAVAAYLTTVLHGLRTGFCDFLAGSAHFALGPVVGALLAGAWGSLAGEIAGGRQRRWVRIVTACAVAVAGPLVSMGLSASRFYSSPMVFAYDPFVGYFSGTLYDTVIDASGLLTYRVGTAATLFAAFVAALHLAHDDQGRLAFQAIGRPGMLVLGGLSLAGSVTAIVNGNRLGHWQTAETMGAELGALVTGERCDVVYPRSMRLADAQRFARDCDAHVLAQERWFGSAGPPRLTAYLFLDARQKAALMGAADTQVAKPWRREIYLQAAGYPHHSLGHEIAHVFAGTFASGPFKVAGSAGGLVPNPGLIEGLAVAASPREGDLSPRDWAKAMKDLGLLPPLSRLFAFGFFGENSSTAYTASGAFVGWVKDNYGADALRAWYGGRDLDAVTGAPWSALEQAWHGDLDQVVLPEAAKAQAKARFDRPAIFGRRCPHVVDACKQQAEALRGAGDDIGAIQKYQAALVLDPKDGQTQVAIAMSTIQQGKTEEGTRELERIVADEATPRHVRDRALEHLADLALTVGDLEKAIAGYREVMTRLVDEDQLRTLEVKIAAASDVQARGAVVALLIGSRGRGPEKIRAAELLGAWSRAEPDDGLPQYLLARHYFNAGEFDDAADRLDRALTKKLGIMRVRVEAERLRVVTACALGDAATARKFFAGYTARTSVMPARREGMRGLVERCSGAPVAGSDPAGAGSAPGAPGSPAGGAPREADGDAGAPARPWDTDGDEHPTRDAGK